MAVAPSNYSRTFDADVSSTLRPVHDRPRPRPCTLRHLCHFEMKTDGFHSSCCRCSAKPEGHGWVIMTDASNLRQRRRPTSAGKTLRNN